MPSRVGALAASRAGQRSIEHLYDILVATSTEEAEVRAGFAEVLRAPQYPASTAQLHERAITDRLLRTFSPQKAAALFAELRRNGTYQTPTLVTIGNPRCLDPAASGVDSVRLRQLPAGLHRFVQPAQPTPDELALACRRFARQMELVGQMHRAGVPILAGSDAPQSSVYPGFALHDELALLVRAGLPPQEALRAATLTAARYLDAADTLGAVRPGMRADLLLLEANPLEAIGNTRRIAGVMARGRWLPREELDRRVAAAANPPARAP